MARKIHRADEAGNPACMIVATGKRREVSSDPSQVTCQQCLRGHVTRKREDVHRPSAIVPTEYEYVACEHIQIETFGDCAAVLANREIIRRHMEATGGTYSGHEHGGNCHICGASARYTILFYHAKTNTYIRTGGDCAQKLEMSTGDLDHFKKAISDAREAHAGKKKACAILADAGLSQCFDIYTGEGITALYVGGYEHEEENTVRDIVGKLVKYGSISEKATGYLKQLLERIARRPEIEAQRAAERAKAEPCPSGRVKIAGQVLKTKLYGTDFGETLKMTVKDDRGFLIFCTVPAGAGEVKHGDRIEFNATVSPSDRDEKFGFAKRPKLIRRDEACESSEQQTK